MIELSPFAQTTLQLFGGVLGVLLLASGIGAVLKWRVAHGQPHSVIDNLNARVNAWWVMVAAIGLAFAFGKGGVIVLFYLISFYALREFISLAYTRRGDHHALAAAFGDLHVDAKRVARSEFRHRTRRRQGFGLLLLELLQNVHGQSLSSLTSRLIPVVQPSPPYPDLPVRR